MNLQLLSPLPSGGVATGTRVGAVAAGTSTVTVSPADEASVGADGHRLPLRDFLGPGVAVVLLALIGWVAWKWSQKRATRGLRRAVRRARRFNEQTQEMEFPHPVPEMEAERQSEPRPPVQESPRPRGPAPRRRTEPQETEPPSEPILDPHDLDALKRLEALQAEWNPKEPRLSYRRLDGFVRRYLFEAYGVRAFGMRVSEVLAALPRSVEDATFDYVAEILTTCELAELPRHRPSRREMEHLIGLARELVVLHARAFGRSARPEE